MASFRTAYLQREIPIDVAVKATVQTGDSVDTPAAKAFKVRQTNPDALTAVKVGDMVVLTPATDVLPASIVRTLSLAEATHIVAQSDATMENGHIPDNHRYFPMVNGTYATSLLAATPVKKVALYKITEREDVIIDVSQGEIPVAEEVGGTT